MSKSKIRAVYGVHRFEVEIEGLRVAGFSEVEGLSIETEMEEYREGGLNSFIHQFPVITKFEPLVLKRGFSDSSSADLLWDWYKDFTRGKIMKKSGSIILNDQAGNEICRWNFFQAQPTSWRGPAFNSSSSEIAIESFQLVHEGLKLEFETNYDTSWLYETK